MVDIQHPLKKEIDQCAAKANKLDHLYKLYFGGIEKYSPQAERKELDGTIQRLRGDVSRSSNAGVIFAFRQLEARFQMLKKRWDKTLSEIEAGTFRIPPKRK